jgi:hypothetical protein
MYSSTHSGRMRRFPPSLTKASPQAAPLARRPRRALALRGPARRTPGHTPWGTCPGPLIRQLCRVGGSPAFSVCRSSSTGPPRYGSSFRLGAAPVRDKRGRLVFVSFELCFVGGGFTRRVIVKASTSPVKGSNIFWPSLSTRRTLRATPWHAPSLLAGQNILEAASGQAFDSRRSSHVWRLSGEGPKAANSKGRERYPRGNSGSCWIGGMGRSARLLRMYCAVSLPVPVTGQGRALSQELRRGMDRR